MLTDLDFKDYIDASPMIAAIIDDKTYDFVINSRHKVVFLLDASLSNLRERVDKLLEKDKLVFVHIDMVAGLTSTNTVVDFIGDTFDNKVGIITTKHSLVRRANQKGIKSIYRGFMVDSRSKSIFKDNLKSGIRPDAIEIMPAFLEKVIKEISKEFPGLTLIAGGLITEKKEAYSIINSGASAISTSNLDLLKED